MNLLFFSRKHIEDVLDFFYHPWRQMEESSMLDKEMNEERLLLIITQNLFSPINKNSINLSYAY